MRGIASYAMLGRRQSIITVLLCGFFPLLYCISAGVVGLVSLRKGWREGLLILLWSMLPAGYFWAIGDASPMILMIGVALLSQVLRRSNAWHPVLTAAVVMGILVQLSLAWQTAYVEQLRAIINQALEIERNQGMTIEATADDAVTLLLRYYGLYHMVLVILCLLLARWWQALLYNPGGFGEEFRQLRLDPRFALLLVILMGAGLLSVPPLNQWLAILSVPPLISALALAHSVVALKKLGSHWLVLCYALVVLMAPALVILGLLDSLLDFRKRITV
ncbi:MAG: hypothetical protein RQ899_08015 [Pseudomonadales bacterium]|nr:hypothetical protein [Pseudomonadales bacterium]